MLPDTGRDIDRARQHYDILRLAIEDLARAGDELAIAGIVKHAARQLTHADGVTVVLREDGAFCHYVDEDAIAPLWKGRRFPMETCISGWVMSHAQPAVIPDISIDPRIPQDAYRPTFVRSLAMMPVGGREAVGAIGAYWAQPHTAAPEELADLQRLANSTALALQNLRLQAALESELRARADAEIRLARLGAAAEARESEMRFRVMADTSPLMIWVTDADGNVEFVNRAYVEFFGITEEEIRGPGGWHPLIHPDDAEAYIGAFAGAHRDGTPFFGEVRARRWDGEWRHLASYAAPRWSADGQLLGFVGSSPDVTDMKRAVDLLAETVRLKDEFLATVAHELRQPIHAAVGALGLLEAGASDTRALRAREVLQRQLAHMARMIDDLLDASRIVRGSVLLQQERTDLRRVISLAVETAAPLVEHRGHRLVTTLPNDPVRLDVDSTRIQQVVTNLLSNAAKYTPEGGSIRVALEVDGPHAVIRVQDNGYGIPGDAKDRIFEVFTRVGGESVRGFGIGLAVARKLVEQHRGTIAVHSDGPGQGSEFTVRLPLPSPAD